MNTPRYSDSRRNLPAEERVDVRRYLGALGTSRWLIAAIVVLITGAAVAASLILPKTYTATTSIALEDADTSLGGTDAQSLERRLNTTQALLKAPAVLDRAARRLGTTADELDSKLSSEVNPDANIIDVSAQDGNAGVAAETANTVARVFIAERAALERLRLARARERLEEQIDRLEGQPNADAQTGALRERISQLSVSENSAGSDLQVIGRAERPTSPSSPRPVRNGLLALFASLFLAVLVALGRDQLTPRVGSARELGRALNARVLASVPLVRRRSRRSSHMLSGVEAEAYETLRAAVESAVPPEEQPSLLVTGAAHGEGKTTVAWRLAYALARAGHRTLLISADLRVPRLHEAAGLSAGVGLADILALTDPEDERIDAQLLEAATNEIVVLGHGGRHKGTLHVITSGNDVKDPGGLVSGGAMVAFLRNLKALPYDYFVIDAPPLLGIADSQVMARHVDDTLLVGRLGVLTFDQLAELREVLAVLDTSVLGVVAIGGRGDSSPYYLSRRPPIVPTEADAPR